LYTQKTFLKYKEYKNWHAFDTKERIFYGNKINYILAFKEKPGFRCECNKKNRDKILNEYEGRLKNE